MSLIDVAENWKIAGERASARDEAHARNSLARDLLIEITRSVVTARSAPTLERQEDTALNFLIMTMRVRGHVGYSLPVLNRVCRSTKFHAVRATYESEI